MASSPERAVVMAAAAVSVAACNRETEEDETAEVDAARGPAVAGVDWWSEDMTTATATNTTTTDASATVVTKARLRRLGRARVRKAGWMASRGSVVWLACSHRASGHDMVGVRSQFGIRRRQLPNRLGLPDGCGWQLRSVAGRCYGIRCRPRRRVHDGVHLRVALWLFCRPGVRLLGRAAHNGHSARALGLGRGRLLAPAPRPRGDGGVLVAPWGGGVRSDSTVWEVGAPEGKPLRMSPGQSPCGGSETPRRTSGRGGPEVLLERAEGRLQLGGIGVELLQEGAEL